MTPTARTIAEHFRHGFDALDELDKTAPADVDTIVVSIVSHLRSWRPESVSPIGTLLPPKSPIVDPRAER